MTTKGRIIIAVSIENSNIVAVVSVVTIAIEISIVIYIGISISISILIAIYIAIKISISVVIAIVIFIYIYIPIATIIDILVAANTGFHLCLQGMYQLFQCTDLYTEAIIGGVDMFNCLAIRCDRIFQIIESFGSFLLHGNIGNVESRLYWRNMGVFYILVSLRKFYAEVKPDLLWFWTTIPSL